MLWSLTWWLEKSSGSKWNGNGSSGSNTKWGFEFGSCFEAKLFLPVGLVSMKVHLEKLGQNLWWPCSPVGRFPSYKPAVSCSSWIQKRNTGSLSEFRSLYYQGLGPLRKNLNLVSWVIWKLLCQKRRARMSFVFLCDSGKSLKDEHCRTDGLRRLQAYGLVSVYPETLRIT